MRIVRLGISLASALILLAPSPRAQNRPRNAVAELRLHIAVTPSRAHHSVTAVVWLDPLGNTPALPFTPQSRYTLLQKNRTFMPHLQVVPVGSVVQFPNADPFFHNVFSMFDGKRFDLGLYEAGSSKSVTFSRPGVSYIFCNIHPEMSAVIISLATPLYSIASASNAVDIRNIPPGDYRLHLWVEGALPGSLQSLSRELHLSPGADRPRQHHCADRHEHHAHEYVRQRLRSRAEDLVLNEKERRARKRALDLHVCEFYFFFFARGAAPSPRSISAPACRNPPTPYAHVEPGCNSPGAAPIG